MPIPALHILIGSIGADIYRRISNKLSSESKQSNYSKESNYSEFPKYFLIFSALGSLIPDFDYIGEIFFTEILNKSSELFMHGGIFHSPFILIFFVLGILISHIMNKTFLKNILIFTCIGYMLHIIADFMLNGGNELGLMILFPFSLTRYAAPEITSDLLLAIIRGIGGIIVYVWFLIIFSEKKN